MMSMNYRMFTEVKPEEFNFILSRYPVMIKGSLAQIQNKLNENDLANKTLIRTNDFDHNLIVFAVIN